MSRRTSSTRTNKLGPMLLQARTEAAITHYRSRSHSAQPAAASTRTDQSRMPAQLEALNQGEDHDMEVVAESVSGSTHVRSQRDPRDPTTISQDYSGGPGQGYGYGFRYGEAFPSTPPSFNPSINSRDSLRPAYLQVPGYPTNANAYDQPGQRYPNVPWPMYGSPFPANNFPFYAVPNQDPFFHGPSFRPSFLPSGPNHPSNGASGLPASYSSPSSATHPTGEFMPAPPSQHGQASSHSAGLSSRVPGPARGTTRVEIRSTGAEPTTQHADEPEPYQTLPQARASQNPSPRLAPSSHLRSPSGPSSRLSLPTAFPYQPTSRKRPNRQGTSSPDTVERHLHAVDGREPRRDLGSQVTAERRLPPQRSPVQRNNILGGVGPRPRWAQPISQGRTSSVNQTSSSRASPRPDQMDWEEPLAREPLIHHSRFQRLRTQSSEDRDWKESTSSTPSPRQFAEPTPTPRTAPRASSAITYDEDHVDQKVEIVTDGDQPCRDPRTRGEQELPTRVTPEQTIFESRPGLGEDTEIESEIDIDDGELDDEIAQAEELETQINASMMATINALAERHSTLESRILDSVVKALDARGIVLSQEDLSQPERTAPRSRPRRQTPTQEEVSGHPTTPARKTKDPRSLEEQFTSRAIACRREDLGYYSCLIMRIVRTFMETMMRRTRAPPNRKGRKRKLSPIPPPPGDPTNDEPTRDNFTLAWDEDIYCHYNVAASVLFVDELLDDEIFSEVLPAAASTAEGEVADEDQIRETFTQAFWIHARYLKDQYSLQVKGLTAGERAHLDRKDAIRGRRNRRLNTRKADCRDLFPELLRLLEIGGVACTSSDDEGPVQGPGVPPLYIHSIMTWRGFKLTALVRYLDEGHRVDRIGTRGNQPRHRREGAHISRRQPPKGLPRNCYCEEWLATLSQTALAKLKIRPACPALDAWYALHRPL